MQCLIVLETVDVVESALACVVRQVESESPVESDDEEVEVVSYAYTGSDGYLSEEAVEAEDAWFEEVFHGLFLTHVDVIVPHVASVEEESRREASEEASPVFEVGHEFDVSVVEDVVVLTVAEIGRSSRSDASYGEGKLLAPPT